MAIFMQLYTDDNNEKFPGHRNKFTSGNANKPDDWWGTAIVPYGQNTNMFRCKSLKGRHLVVVYTGSGIQVYWDGELAGASSQTLKGPIGPTQFGSSSNLDTTEGWIGALDEIALYADPLSPETILAHYEALVGQTEQPEPVLNYVITDAGLSISWSNELIGFTIESTSNLSAASWEDVEGVNNNSVTVESTVGIRFFRLNKP